MWLYSQFCCYVFFFYHRFFSPSLSPSPPPFTLLSFSTLRSGFNRMPIFRSVWSSANWTTEKNHIVKRLLYRSYCSCFYPSFHSLLGTIETRINFQTKYGSEILTVTILSDLFLSIFDLFFFSRFKMWSKTVLSFACFYVLFIFTFTFFNVCFLNDYINCPFGSITNQQRDTVSCLTHSLSLPFPFSHCLFVLFSCLNTRTQSCDSLNWLYSRISSQAILWCYL